MWTLTKRSVVYAQADVSMMTWRTRLRAVKGFSKFTRLEMTKVVYLQTMMEEKTSTSLIIGWLFIGIFSGSAFTEVLPPTTDFDYYFPKKSPEYAVFLHDLPLEQDLTVFTACVWIKTNYIGTIFSYTAVQDDDIMMNVTPNVVYLWILSERRGAFVNNRDYKWRHYCVMWRSSDGYWKFLVDGYYANHGIKLKMGKTIPKTGSLVIGQDQDSYAGGFTASDAFGGFIHNLNIWDTILSREEIFELAKSCSAGEGNVYKWSDFLNEAYNIKAYVAMPSFCT